MYAQDFVFPSNRKNVINIQTVHVFSNKKNAYHFISDTHHYGVELITLAEIKKSMNSTCKYNIVAARC
jgi:hypothetical protein